MARPCVWEELVGQERAAKYLEGAVRSGKVSHAYLFVGPPGAGKKTAAKALACALICDDDGCGVCPTCYRVKRGFHPDVRLIEPEGAATYLVQQVRAIVRDVSLTPVEGSRKIYILDSSDFLNEASANALLKTLEEPPDDAVFVLLSGSYEAVPQTVVSRCQVVRFSRMPSDVAVGVLVEKTGARADEAAAALAAAGGVLSRALDFLNSSSRRATRELVLRTMKDLPVMDGHDVLVAVRSLMTSVKAPLDELKALQAAEVREREEFLGTSRRSAKPLEERHKREITAREREGLLEVFAVTESWLRDCLALSQGAADLVVNRDVLDAMEEVASTLASAAAIGGVNAVKRARSRVSYNVSPQLATEAMLFDIREAIRCPRSWE